MKQWTVAQVMTTDVVSVPADTPYAKVVATLADRKVGALPVVDTFGRVLGVVSESDLLHKVEFIGAEPGHRFFEWGTRRVNRVKAQAATAGDLMTAPAVTIQAEITLVEAAKRMEHEHVKRLPVVDDIGHLIGIVSRRDLLKMYLRSDDDICEEVTEGVLRQMLWIDPLTVKACVADGVVTLTGEVDRRSSAQICAHVCRQVPGVVQVVERLSWSYDDTVATAGTGL